MTSPTVILHNCDARRIPEPDASVQCVVTSIPYWRKRQYGHPDELGREATPDQYIANMVEVFRDVRRVLRDDGTLWLNCDDTAASGGRGGGGQLHV